MQSTEDAVSLFSKDQFLLPTNISSFPQIDQKISIDLSLCPSCKKHDFSISADPLTICYCKEKDGECANCTCSNIRTAISVRNFPCKYFRFKAREDRLNVELYNSSVGLITIYEGSENHVSFYLQETKKTSLSVVIRGLYQRVHIWEGTLFHRESLDFYLLGTISNILANYFKTGDGQYLAVKKINDDS